MSDVRWPWQRKGEQVETDPLLDMVKAKQDEIAREQDRILVMLARNEDEVQVLARRAK